MWVLDYNLDPLEGQSMFLTTGPSPATWSLIILFTEYLKLFKRGKQLLRNSGRAYFMQKSRDSLVRQVRRLFRNSGTQRLPAGARTPGSTSGSMDLDSPRWTARAANPRT